VKTGHVQTGPVQTGPVQTGPVQGESGHVLAVDVGGTGIKAEVLRRDLTPLVAGVAATPRGDGSATLSAVTTLARELLDRLPDQDRDRVAAVGLAVPGLVDSDAGVAVRAANLGWHDTPVTARVGQDLGLPTVLSHDVTAAGLAEWRHGAGRRVDDLLVVVIGTGIAATVVCGGTLVRGGAGQAGEIGHVVVRPGGPLCGCGQHGCLEAVASARAIAQQYSVASGREVQGAAAVHSLLGADPVADTVWRDAAYALADGLLMACTLLGTSRIVLGGGLSSAGAALLDPVRARLVEQARIAAVPDLVVAQLGERAGVIGAALAVWERDADLTPQRVAS
jgi:glucokinase